MIAIVSILATVTILTGVVLAHKLKKLKAENVALRSDVQYVEEQKEAIEALLVARDFANATVIRSLQHDLQELFSAKVRLQQAYTALEDSLEQERTDAERLERLEESLGALIVAFESDSSDAVLDAYNALRPLYRPKSLDPEHK